MLAALLLALAAPTAGADPLVRYFPKGPANGGSTQYVALGSDGAVWTQSGGGVLSRINPSTGVATSGFPLDPPGSHPGGIATAGTNLWTSDYVLSNVTRVGPGSGIAAGPQAVPGGPVAPAPGLDGTAWFVAGVNGLLHIGLDGLPTAGFPAGTGIAEEPGYGVGPVDISPDSSGGAWVAARSSNTTSPHGWLLHVTNGGVVDVTKTISGYRPDLVEVTTGGDIWVVSLDGWISRFDSGGTIRSGYPKGLLTDSSTQIAAAPSGDLWIGDTASSIARVKRFSVSTDAIDQDVPFAFASAGFAQATGIAVDPNGDPWVGLNTSTGGANSLAHVFVGGVDLSGNWTDPTGTAGPTTPGAVAPPAATAPPAGPPAVTAAPVISATVAALAPLRAGRLVAARVLRVPVRFSAAGTARVSATVKPATARALKLTVRKGAKSVPLATAKVVAGAPGTVSARLALPAKAIAALRAHPRAFSITVSAVIGTQRSTRTLRITR